MAQHHTLLEIERKYDVDGDLRPPQLVGIGAIAVESGPETAELVATYYDTGELRLARQRVAVRSRRGGSDEGWHVKLPPAGEGRPELHWPLGDGAEPPAELRAVIRDRLGDGELVPVARVTNVRDTTVLKDAAGFELAELCDDHVRGENLRTGGTDSWREWEVELLSGAPDSRERRTALLDGIEAALLAAGARPAALSSKLERVLGL